MVADRSSAAIAKRHRREGVVVRRPTRPAHEGKRRHRPMAYHAADEPRCEEHVKDDGDERKRDEGQAVRIDHPLRAVTRVHHPAHRGGADDVRNRENDPAPEPVIAHEQHRQEHADAPGPAHAEIRRPAEPVNRAT